MDHLSERTRQLVLGQLSGKILNHCRLSENKQLNFDLLALERLCITSDLILECHQVLWQASNSNEDEDELTGCCERELIPLDIFSIKFGNDYCEERLALINPAVFNIK